jgi:peptide/nickel transport system permease protein
MAVGSNAGQAAASQGASRLSGQRKTVTQSQRVLREITRNPLALTGAVYLTVITLVAIFAPLLAPHSPIDQNLMLRLDGPSVEHWLGTDAAGRDVVSRLMYGARISLFIGLIGTAGGVLFGTIIGLVSGYYGGKIDTLAMRLIDIMYAFPGILLAILIVAIMGPSMANLIIALVVWGTPTLARIVRGVVFSLREREFIEAARTIGASDSRIVFLHLLPNCLAPIIVYATLGVAGALLTAAGLGFLGLGVQPPTAEWGAMLSSGRDYIRTSPYLVTAPGLLIFTTVLALNLVGDALRDALDPRTG